MTEPTAAAPVCYRHPDRETWIRCQRCDKPICPDCMNSAAVGFQCPSCVKEGSKATRSGRLPYGGERRGGNPALTSFVLIGLNLAVWIAIRANESGRTLDGLSNKLALRPNTLTVTTPAGDFTLEGVAGGAYWQVLTSAFAHIEVSHIAFNMIALYFLGPQLEAVLGRARFLALYLTSALTGSLAVMWLSAEYSSTLGASGAIFGLLGALLVLTLKVGGDVQGILVWVGINVAFTVFAGSSISWQGHLGGFVGGALVAGLLAYAPKGERRALLQWSGIAATVLVTLLLIAVRAAVLA